MRLLQHMVGAVEMGLEGLTVLDVVLALPMVLIQAQVMDLALAMVMELLTVVVMVLDKIIAQVLMMDEVLV